MLFWCDLAVRSSGQPSLLVLFRVIVLHHSNLKLRYLSS